MEGPSSQGRAGSPGCAPGQRLLGSRAVHILQTRLLPVSGGPRLPLPLLLLLLSPIPRRSPGQSPTASPIALPPCHTPPPAPAHRASAALPTAQVLQLTALGELSDMPSADCVRVPGSHDGQRAQEASGPDAVGFARGPEGKPPLLAMAQRTGELAFAPCL